MTRTKLIIFISIAAIVTYLFFAFDVPYRKTIDDFATCAAAGNPIMESFPRQCRDATGKTYTEAIEQGSSPADRVFMDSPASGARISSPVKLSGQARGPWFFEASFPVQIIAADGVTVLGQGPAQAKAADGAWMTDAFVPWGATIAFDRGTAVSGFIRLQKDNPSGDPARDEHLDIPVAFATSTASK